MRKKELAVFCLLIILSISFVSAVWWNPFSWFDKEVREEIFNSPISVSSNPWDLGGTTCNESGSNICTGPHIMDDAYNFCSGGYRINRSTYLGWSCNDYDSNSSDYEWGTPFSVLIDCDNDGAFSAMGGDFETIASFCGLSGASEDCYEHPESDDYELNCPKKISDCDSQEEWEYCSSCKYAGLYYCQDKDGDGYTVGPDYICGNGTLPPKSVLALNPSPGVHICAGGFDCEDYDASINPGVTEVCDDGFDNNCNTLADCAESSTCLSLMVPTTSGGTKCDFFVSSLIKSCCSGQCENLITIFKDDDGDGEGDYNKAYRFCPGMDLPSGYVLNAYDCDDSNPDVMSERCGDRACISIWPPVWKIPGDGNECKKCGVVSAPDPLGTGGTVIKGAVVFHDFNPASLRNCFYCDLTTVALKFINNNDPGDGDCFYCDFSSQSAKLDPPFVLGSDSNRFSDGKVDCKICDWQAGSYQKLKSYLFQANLSKDFDDEDLANNQSYCLKCSSGNLVPDDTDTRIIGPTGKICYQCSGGKIELYPLDPRFLDPCSTCEGPLLDNSPPRFPNPGYFCCKGLLLNGSLYNWNCNFMPSYSFLSDSSLVNPCVSATLSHLCHVSDSSLSYFIIAENESNESSYIAYKISPSGINFNLPYDLEMSYSSTDFEKTPSLYKFNDSVFENSKFDITLLNEVYFSAGLNSGVGELGDLKITIPANALDVDMGFKIERVNISIKDSEQTSFVPNQGVLVSSIISWIIGSNTQLRDIINIIKALFLQS